MRQLKFCIMGAAMIAIAGPKAAMADDFNYAAPSSATRTIKLWSTRYYVHYVDSSETSDAAPLYRQDGTPLGVSIPKSQFCFAALQGTLAVKAGSTTTVYNAAGLSQRQSANCAYRKLTPAVNSKLGRQAWVPVTGNGKFGLGVRTYRLLPFRTIAVDAGTIPYGTVLFIPQLRGFKFDDGGEARVHDGYVFAGDTGGAIKKNHIDFFTGGFTGPPPAFVTSRSTGLFEAQIVTDTHIIDELTREAAYKP